MRKAIQLCTFIIIFYYSTTMIAHAQPPIEIEAFQWTDTVDSSTRQYNKKLSSPTKSKEIWLWMRLKGSRELLEQLRQTPDGKLPIRHSWFRYEADQLSADIDVTIPLSIGRREDLQKLTYEVDSDGYFHWRIWSKRTNLSKGWWRVDVLDDFGNPLYCIDKDTQKPCSFKIEVR